MAFMALGVHMEAVKEYIKRGHFNICAGQAWNAS